MSLIHAHQMLLPALGRPVRAHRTSSVVRKAQAQPATGNNYEDMIQQIPAVSMGIKRLLEACFAQLHVLIDVCRGACLCVHMHILCRSNNGCGEWIISCAWYMFVALGTGRFEVN